MKRLTILHSNDIHGHLEGFSRIASRVRQTRAQSPHPVLYLDAGDIEETNNRLSSATKGVAMHSLLSTAGCDAATVGNGGLLRYSHLQLAQYAQVAAYPLSLANLVLANGEPIAGVQFSTLLEVGDIRVGVIGLTDPFSVYSSLFGLTTLEVVPLVRGLSLELRQTGADLIVVLSHLGWERREPEAMTDQKLALGLQDEIDLIIGAHTHHLLEHGVQLGRVWVAQAGKYAQHLGCTELEQRGGAWDIVCGVETITPAIVPDPQILAHIKNLEQQLEVQMAEVVCVLGSDYVYHELEQCTVGTLVAEALRDYWNADVGLSIAGIGFRHDLHKGELTRGMVVESLTTAASPMQVKLCGWQLLEVVKRGQDPKNAAKPLLCGGLALGFLHVAGMTRRDEQWFVGTAPLDLEKVYIAAATDAELDGSFAYMDTDWTLQPECHIDVVLNQVVLAYLQRLNGV